MEEKVTPSDEERRTLERLARQARRERRDVRPPGDPRTETPTGGAPRPEGGTQRHGRSEAARKSGPARRALRRLLKWLAIGMAIIMLLAVLYPPFLIPVEGAVTSRFFLRTNPESVFLFDVEHHRGIDFGAQSGTPVRAARSGRVVAVQEHPTYGLMVEIRHPFGLHSRYAHMSATSAREGQWVWRRGRIGAVGMTGRATGPHLHFEITAGERSLPPGFFLMFHSLRGRIVS